MVNRQRLTPDLVNSAVPPRRGERWIADTELAGFGLRLWATRSGYGKAFAIRTVSPDGKVVRRAFDLQSSWEFSLAISSNELGELGEYLAMARRWAHEEIRQIKGFLSEYEATWARRVRTAATVLERNLQELAETSPGQMRKRQVSDAYVDYLDKLFSVHLPLALRQRPLSSITPADIATAFADTDISPTALPRLRWFLRRIFEQAAAANTKSLGARLT